MDVFDAPCVLGAGPVGRAVVAALVELGAEPVVVTRSGTELVGATARRADVGRPDEAAATLAGASVVFHAAQPPYHRWAEEFPALQRSVVAACRAADAPLVAVDNLYGYGAPAGPMTEASPVAPASDKGRVRARMWDDLLAAHRAGQLDVAAVRASDFLGPWVLQSAYGERFVGRLTGGRKAEVLGSPAALHSVTYPPDLARAMVAVAADPRLRGRVWHAPCAPAVAQVELVEQVARAAGVEPRSAVVKRWQLRLAGLIVPAAGEVAEMVHEFEHDFVVDSSAFEAATGHTATPLAEAVASAVAWYRARST